MRLRRATDSDFQPIQTVLDQLMPAAERRRRAIWSELLHYPGYAAWVAEVDSKIVGFLDLYMWPDLGHGERVGLVSNLVVDEEFRGKELGQNLLREAIQYCQDQEAVELHVWTDFDNVSAIALYRKLEFADRGLLLERQIRDRL